jgi:hypothetical protein
MFISHQNPQLRQVAPSQWPFAMLTGSLPPE